MLRGTTAMLAPVGLVLLWLAVGSRCEDTVAANVGHHTMDRIAELLSPSECHQLQRRLVGPDEDLDERELERLSEEKNPIRPRRRRALAGCSEALRAWLRTAGQVVTWDRLARGLRHIGRSDIARELGKNLSQDKSLELRKNVEEYGRSRKDLTSSPLLQGERRGGTRRDRRALDGDWGDLRFERRPPPPYTRSLLGWVGPLVSGIVGGFLASILFAVAIAYSCHWTLGLDT